MKERTDAAAVILKESKTNIKEKGGENASIFIDPKFNSPSQYNKKRLHN